MVGLVKLLGLLMVSVGVLALLKPAAVFGPLRRNAGRPVVYIGAVLGRLVFGALLVIVSDQAKHPVLIDLLGWLLLVSAVALVVMGRARFERLVCWVLDKGRSVARPGGMAAVLLGGYLVYAFS